jgi:photosystem II PsbY protein
LGAEEVAKIAAASDNDSRGLLLLVVLAPAVGWVLFNILRPALNQLDRMRSSSKAVIGGGIGIGAMSSLLSSSSQHSDAEAMAMAMAMASSTPDELASIAVSADNDSRGLLLLIVIAPAIGWVLFNILRPALNQLDKMRGK